MIQNHLNYRNLQFNEKSLNQLFKNNNIFDQLIIYKVIDLDGLDANIDSIKEELMENENGLICDEAVVFNIIVKDSKLTLL